MLEPQNVSKRTSTVVDLRNKIGLSGVYRLFNTGLEF
jgi:hypothetical protein